MTNAVQGNLENDPKIALSMQVERLNMAAKLDCRLEATAVSHYLICSTPRSGSNLLGGLPDISYQTH